MNNSIFKRIFSAFSILIMLVIAGCNSEGYFGDANSNGNGVSGYPGVSASDIAQLQLIPVTPVPKGSSDIQIPIDAGMNVRVLATLNDNRVLDLTNYVTWSSDNKVVSLPGGGLVLGDETGTAKISADYLGKKTNEIEVNVVNKTLKTLQISPNPITAEQNQTVDLMATAHYEDGTTENVSDYVSWLVSNSTANISIDGSSHLEGKSIGTGILTASWGRVNSENVNVTITASTNDAINTPVSLQLIPSQTTIPKGVSTPIQVIAHYAGGLTEDITENVETVVTFADPSILKLSTNNNHFVGVNVGQTQVTASYLGVTSNSVLMTVTDAVPLSLTISPTTQNIPKGLTHQYQAVAIFSDGTTFDATNDVTWYVGDANVATIDNLYNLGVLTANQLGSTTVWAQLQNVLSETATATVTTAIIQSLTITPNQQTVAIGETLPFVANAVFSDETTLDVSGNALWQIGDTSIATVDNSGAVTGVSANNTTLIAHFNGMTSDAAEVEVITAVLQSIQITPALLDIPNGLHQQYQAIGHYSNGSTADITGTVSWNTSNSTIATIATDGQLTAAAIGATTITAVHDGVTSNDSAVNVTNAVLTEIQVTPAVETTHVGLHQQYQAVGFFSDKSSRDITTEVSWLSSATNVASMNLTGQVTGVAVGNAEVTANLNGITSNTAQLTVDNAILVEIDIAPLLITLPLGETQQYTAVGLYSDGSNQDITTEVTWSIDDTSIATIDNTALLTAASLGTTKVNASLNGLTSATAAQVNVTNASLVQLIVTPESTVDLHLGLHRQFHAQGVFSDGSARDVTNEVSWDSSNISIATINTTGSTEAVGIGSTNITANMAGITSNTEVLTVTTAALVEIVVLPDNAIIPKGLTVNYTAQGHYTDSTTLDLTNDVTWHSQDANIATIVSGGTATTVNIGTTAIHASFGVIESTPVQLTVDNATLTSIAITPEIASVSNGQTQQYQALGTYTDGNTLNITNSVTWVSGQTNIATIDTAGLASSSIVSGTTTIQATLDTRVSNTATLNVGPVLTSVSLEYGAPGLDTTITNGSSRSLKLVGHYSDTTQKVLNTPFDNGSVWTHTGSGFTHTGNGHYQATSTSGTISVTATYEGFSDTMTNAITAVPVSNRDCGVSPLTLSNGTRVYCPLRTNSPEIADPSIYGSQSFTGLGGPNGMELITANYTQVEALCTSLGRRLPTQLEFQLLTQEYALEDVPAPLYGVYHLVGWPAEVLFYTDFNENGKFVRASLTGSSGLLPNGTALYGVICVD
ncbi:BIG2 domain-containing protein [Vibrio crassostreae]|nr:Ig-like domain-containing protein [Vibrio crassostreae]TCL15450.1 Ig-like protein group 2 [Vibrio crassostreae]TCM98715.1 Ig-like protein group 2 [Vibrio crassostreae]TCT41208.1 Ig-like protein group 2 [Vibrio crassostreae]TCT45550.1 Ig-like protein group 2 [Vibrio crassostreae]TCT69214.1 Ig-like protein group 2 [Vibrio crassostreae]